MLDFLAAAAERLQYDREAIAGGQLWRLVTGHFVHFGLEHLLWDAAVFVVLALLCWRLEARRCLASLAAAALGIPAVLWILEPDLQTYRGLSGLDSALYVTAAVTLGQRLRSEGRPALSAAALASVALLVAKVAFELSTGRTLFVDAASLGFVPVPAAHLAGAYAGLLACSRAAAPRPIAAMAAAAASRPLPPSFRTARLTLDGHRL